MPEPITPRAVVVDTSGSPRAQLRPVPVNAVTLTDTFWAPRLRLNRKVTLPSQFRHLQETGRLENFRRAAGQSDAPFVGIYFNDSDVYKWLEAASWSLATHPDDAPLRAMADETVALIAGAQRPDGYLNTYFSRERADERWTNLRDMHELYCAGHLFQAAVAHWRATGERTLLNVATRFADHICDTFGPAETGRRPGTCGHPEIEMALVELSRATGERRYLEQAGYFIDARGASPSAAYNNQSAPMFPSDGRYLQDHVPFRQLDEVTGHAVRMIYLTCGATDVYTETGDESLKAALDAQWENMTERRMYVTGGLGARHEGEAFGKDYELPSERAYAETCAAIAHVMWAWRMLQATGEARYADLMELALYNGVLSGLSLDGQEYFYVNPLADDGTHRRQPWFGCACCPPNVARLLASLPGYFYSTQWRGDLRVWVHLYASGTAILSAPEKPEHTITLRQETNYPWSGEVTITVESAPAETTRLFLRIPAWAEGAQVQVNDEEAYNPIRHDPENDGEEYLPQYAHVSRQWRAGDVVRLTLPMAVRRIESHPLVADTHDKAALMRGPLVYCMEQADHHDPENSADVAVPDVRFPSDAGLSTVSRPDLLGGVVTVHFLGLRADSAHWGTNLYQPIEALVPDTAEVVSVTAIPYYAWANRESGPMRVWIPLT